MKFIIDTDPGIDDMYALCYYLTFRLALLYVLHSPDADVIAITTTHGNVSVQSTTKNIYTLFDVLSLHSTHLASDPLDGAIPWKVHSKPVVAVGAETPLNGQHISDAAVVHGQDGIGGSSERMQSIKDAFGKGTPSKHEMYTKSSRHAVDEIFHQLQSNDANSVTLVCLGPLTNLALAIQKDGDNSPILSRLRHVYIMGGCLNSPPGGNITPHAEFNFYADPDAAQVVLQSGLPMTLVPLDVTETCRLKYGVYEETIVPLAKKAPLPSFCTSFLEHVFHFMDSTIDSHEFTYSRSPSPSIRSALHLVDIGNEVRVEPAGSNLEVKQISMENLIESEVMQTAHIAKSTSLAMHDPLCMAIALQPSIITKSKSLPVEVETCAEARTRGMCLVDNRRWRLKPTIQDERKEFEMSLKGEGAKNINVVLKVDTDCFFERFMRTVFGIVWDSKRHSWNPVPNKH